MIGEQLIPGWEEWRVVRREYTVGHSRFDLLLTNDKEEHFLLEVKSCTLFGDQGAMFPDAVTERGRKHLLHLQELPHGHFVLSAVGTSSVVFPRLSHRFGIY